MDRPGKIFCTWLGPKLQLEMNWLELLEKVVVASKLVIQKPFFKGDGHDVSFANPPSLSILCQLSGLPLLPTILYSLERALFRFVWVPKDPMVGCGICFHSWKPLLFASMWYC